MRLRLVRHGQASFGSDDYDRLSALGEAQARALGDWLAGHDHRPVHVLRGRMRRHAQTLDAIDAAFRADGRPLPAAEVVDGLDEFDHTAVIGAFLAERPDHPAAPLLSGGGRPDPRQVLDLLVSAIARWSEGGAIDGESWADFRGRTTGTLARMAELAGDGEVLVVSSGGVISQLARHALDAPDATAVRLNLSLRNSAFTELVPHRGRFHLHSWNELPHLAADPSRWTYF